MKINVCETFASIQGEGPYTGVPAFFVRLSGCNLRCDFCDTKYSTDVEGTPTEIGDLITKISAFGRQDLIITGGEPLIQRSAVSALINRIRRANPLLRIHLETNGTIIDRGFYQKFDVICFSPKLSQFEYKEAHKILYADLIDTDHDVFFKFPVRPAIDVPKVIEFVKNIIEKGRGKVPLVYFSPVWPYQDLTLFTKEIESLYSNTYAKQFRITLQLHKLVKMR